MDNDRNPFSGGQNPSGNGQRPFSYDSPDPGRNNGDGFMKKAKKFITGSAKIIAAAVVIAAVAFSSVYQLESREEGVVTRLGKYVRTETEAGLRLKLPFIENVQRVNVEQIRRMEFGFRSSNQDAYPLNADDPYIDESKMLTSDENLVIADWAILYNISNSYDYLFNVNDPEETLRVVAESSYRRVVASHPLDDILTNQKDIIQNEILVDLQEICNKYGLGVTITNVQLQDAMPPDEVKDAFLDVTNALEEKNAKINNAMKYENEKLPLARGEAVKVENDAEAYKQQRINEASGAVARYKAIEDEYVNMPGVMRTRMYLEMVSDVFPKLSHIYFVDENGETVKFLPIGEQNTVLTSPSEGN